MTKNIKKEIISLLAIELGIESEDISMEDSFGEDLHMGPIEIADFAQRLEEHGYNIDPTKLSELEAVGDLIEHFNEEAV